MAYIGRDTDKISNVEVLDNITFDGSSSYTLQKGGSNFTPSSANTLLVSIDGVVQAGNFTVSGSTIDFGTAVAGTSTCDFILHYGVGLITTPADGTVTEAKIGTGAITPVKLGYDYNQYRNIIINGDMSIAQRGTSFSSVSAGNGTYPVDRFRNTMATAGTWTISQDTTVPSGQGFVKSVKYDCTTANASLSAGSAMIFQQLIEAQNLQYLKYGTVNAENLTASFWVKSNKTGTYIVDIYADDGTRQISKSYTIDSANTWEKKTLTFAGDTSGVINNDNGTGFQFNFWLAAGSDYTSGTLSTTWTSNTNANRAVGQVNLADSTANEWYITGVQLEAGTSASDFEFLPYDVNLKRCLRYYYQDDVNIYLSVRRVSDSARWTNLILPVPMRTAPTFTGTTSTEIGNASLSQSSEYAVGFSMSGSADNNARWNTYNFSAEL
jgi:hypothetical protein